MNIGQGILETTIQRKSIEVKGRMEVRRSGYKVIQQRSNSMAFEVRNLHNNKRKHCIASTQRLHKH